MRKAARISTSFKAAICCLTATVTASMLGCPPAAMNGGGGGGGTTGDIPIGFDLGANNLGEFTVKAGVPQSKLITFTVTDAPNIEIGGGSWEIPLDGVEVAPSDTGGGKSRPSAQDIDADDLEQAQNCLDACNLTTAGATVCDDVCNNGIIDVTVTVGTTTDLQADCNDGDTYNFRITLDANTQPTSVTASPNMFIGNTQALIDSREFAACITVVSPIDGTVFINELQANVRP